MKRVFFILGILVYSLKLHAQQSNDEYKTMIDSAIKIKYAQLQDASKRLNNKYYFEKLYLLNEQDRALNYLNSSNKFKLIDVYDAQNRKTISKGIYAWKILTVLNKNQFKVSIMDFYITYKNHNYNFSNSGGSEAIFEYNCGEEVWKLVGFKTSGI